MAQLSRGSLRAPFLFLACFLDIALGLAVFTFPAALAAEPPPTTLRFHNITLADGLSHTRVHQIHQDSQGYLWFATQKGLNRYDGHRIKQYFQRIADPDALADDYILSLESSEDGFFWLGTKTGGAHRFDLQTETFERFGLDEIDPASRIPTPYQGFAQRWSQASLVRYGE